ncbi:hypothetical protein ACQ4PT_045754 [Festuca glaucescens]
MDAACESCALWRDHCYWDHRKDEKKPQFSVVASDDFKKSVVTYTPKNFIPFEGQDLTPLKLNAPNDIMYDVVVIWEMGQAVLRSGWDAFVTAHQIQENDTFLFMYLGDSNFEIRILDSDGCEKTASYFRPPSDFLGAFPPNVHCDLHLPNEQAAPNPGQVHMPIEFDYTMSTGCHLTPEQDDKVLEIARTISTAYSYLFSVLFLKNIPLQLVDHFKDGTASTTIKLVAPNCHIYTVGASKHSEDQFVLRSGWGAFVVANRIQKNDLLIFSSKEKTRLKVLALDPSGCQKISPYVAMEDVSNTGEDSVQITDPPPRTIETIDLTSSDDDHIKFCEEYASAYLPSSGQTLTLQLEDKEWHTTLYVIPKRKAIHEGWSKFASDNDLRLGDICLFAKRSTASLAMRVHFVRKSGVLL